MNLSRGQRVELGSRTARDGFANERDIAEKFNHFRTDLDAQDWLSMMGLHVEKIKNLFAEVKSGYKSDIWMKVTYRNAQDEIGISIKLVSNPHGFNQIDKRWVDDYAELWAIPDSIVRSLKRFTGEIPPTTLCRDPENRRIFLDELSNSEQKELINFFTIHINQIMTTILMGDQEFPATWMMVSHRQENGTTWALVPMSRVQELYKMGGVQITKRGSLKIGSITMQRKGGDNGRRSANMLQFKMDPNLLFSLR